MSHASWISPKSGNYLYSERREEGERMEMERNGERSRRVNYSRSTISCRSAVADERIIFPFLASRTSHGIFTRILYLVNDSIVKYVVKLRVKARFYNYCSNYVISLAAKCRLDFSLSRKACKISKGSVGSRSGGLKCGGWFRIDKYISRFAVNLYKTFGKHASLHGARYKGDQESMGRGVWRWWVLNFILNGRDLSVLVFPQMLPRNAFYIRYFASQSFSYLALYFSVMAILKKLSRRSQ